MSSFPASAAVSPGHKLEGKKGKEKLVLAPGDYHQQTYPYIYMIIYSSIRVCIFFFCLFVFYMNSLRFDYFVRLSSLGLD